jgi:NADPH:quinone reductase-like Zn-dependent oxidoreductase
VLVRVAATSFNPLDALIRSGAVREVFPVSLPHVPGIDVAGAVAELGGGVDGFAVGDPVIGFLPMTADGAAAEFVVVPAEVLTAAPSSIPPADAAALPAVGLTAWQALVDHADLRSGQRVLVNGAGGAVGGYAVQLAKQVGATVIATAAPRSAERVRSYGADQVVDYTATSVADAVTEPVDLVLNLAPVPPADLAALSGLVRSGGVLLSTTTPASDDAERGVRGANVYVRSDAAQLAHLVAEVDAGRLHVHVGHRYPLSDLASVHARTPAGKVVLLANWS